MKTLLIDISVSLACDIYSFYSVRKGKKKQFLYSNKEILGQMDTGDTVF